MSDRRTITLTIGEQDFNFSLGAPEVTKYFNAMSPTNKVSPAFNLLTTSVAQEERAALKELLANPLMTMQVAGALLEEYSPDIEVTVKKPSATPND